jgi:hypothetical protein
MPPPQRELQDKDMGSAGLRREVDGFMGASEFTTVAGTPENRKDLRASVACHTQGL